MHYKITPGQIEAWVVKNFDDFKIRRGGLEIVMPNPFVLGDDKYKFNICLEKKARKKDPHGPETYWVHDWREHNQRWDSSFVKFVQRYKNISFYQAIKEIGGTVSHSILRPENKDEPAQEQEEEVQKAIDLPAGTIMFRDASHGPLREMALRYLRKREISEAKAIAHNLGYGADCIVFPYYEYDILVCWQTRSILEKEFAFPNGAEKEKYLYGFDNVEPTEAVYIVESPIDALTIGDGGLAIGGDSLSDNQIRKLRALLPGTVVLCTDNDSAGRALIKSSYFRLRPYFKDIQYALPPDPHKDWNDLDKECGEGASRAYLESRASRLTPPIALRISSA